jgi:hypothetical protein
MSFLALPVEFLDQFDAPFEVWTEETIANIQLVPCARLRKLLFENFKSRNRFYQRENGLEDEVRHNRKA